MNILEGNKCQLRAWDIADVDALVQHGNNSKIWRNLYDYFPHPYRLEDARAWIETREKESAPLKEFAISHRGQAVGAISLRRPAEDNTNCLVVGYWLGEPFWGLGIGTDAVRTLIPYAFATFPYPRLEARTFHWNTGSQHVLVKCGFTLEGVLRERMIKQGEKVDQLVYGLLRSEVESSAGVSPASSPS